MITRRDVAAKVAAEKARHPERFCALCLWRVQTRSGPSPCPRHKTYVTEDGKRTITFPELRFVRR